MKKKIQKLNDKKDTIIQWLKKNRKNLMKKDF